MQYYDAAISIYAMLNLDFRGHASSRDARLRRLIIVRPPSVRFGIL